MLAEALASIKRLLLDSEFGSVIASEAKQSIAAMHGLLRRFAPRNDGEHRRLP
jgi:hypothetical protein